VLRVLLAVVAALTLGKLVLTGLQQAADPEPVRKLLRLLDTNSEQSLGTLFSSLQLALAAAVLALIGRHEQRLRAAAPDAASARGEPSERHPEATNAPTYWYALSAIFAGLAIDESCSVHELLNEPVRRRLGVSTGALYFAWVVPAVCALAVFAAAFARFWWRLPARTRALYAVSGLLFVTGAVVIEMFGASLWAAGNARSLGYRLSTCIEECCEMTAIALFVFASLEALAQRTATIGVDFAPQPTWREAPADLRLAAPNGGRLAQR
jgi:hypothetical protein